MEDSASDTSEKSQGSQGSAFTVLERSIEEKDGRLVITTVFGPTESELKEFAESPVEPTEPEETAEFAELLEGVFPSNGPAIDLLADHAATITSEKKDK